MEDILTINQGFTFKEDWTWNYAQTQKGNCLKICNIEGNLQYSLQQEVTFEPIFSFWLGLIPYSFGITPSASTCDMEAVQQRKWTNRTHQ